MAHQYSRVGFNSSLEVNGVNLSLSYGGVIPSTKSMAYHNSEYVYEPKLEPVSNGYSVGELPRKHTNHSAIPWKKD